MYVVHNVTNKTIILADLRAEIKPRGILDLERVTSRANIESSRDLQDAIHSKRIQLGRHSVVRTKEKPEDKSYTIVEKERSLDENKIAEMVRAAIKSEMQSTKSEDVSEVVKSAVTKGLDQLVDSLRNKININTNTQQNKNDPVINPEKIAEISQAAIDKISEELQSSEPVLGKKYRINTSVRDLANDL